MKRSLFCLWLVCLLGVPAYARLGEKLSDIQKRYGKPQPQPNKRVALWVVEGEDGQLVYSVTFDAKGISIGEGLKPVRYAKFTRETVDTFIQMQLAPYRESKTIQIVKPGDKYSFGGKIYTVGVEEAVMVDEANDLLIVWTQGAMTSVMAVRQVMMQ